MTIPYNAKPFSNRSYIRDAFKDINIDVEKEELTQCVKAVRSGMNEVVPGTDESNEMDRKEVARAIESWSW